MKDETELLTHVKRTRSGIIEVHLVAERLRLRDIYEAQRLHYRETRSRWTVLVEFVSFLLGILGLVRGSVPLATGAFTTFLLLLFYPQTGLWLIAYLIYNQQTHLQRRSELTISADGVRIDSPISKGKFAWKEFERFAYNEKMILLYPSRGLFYMVPRRAVSSDRDWQDLIELIKPKL